METNVWASAENNRNNLQSLVTFFFKVYHPLVEQWFFLANIAIRN